MENICVLCSDVFFLILCPYLVEDISDGLTDMQCILDVMEEKECIEYTTVSKCMPLSINSIKLKTVNSYN